LLRQTQVWWPKYKEAVLQDEKMSESTMDAFQSLPSEASKSCEKEREKV